MPHKLVVKTWAHELQWGLYSHLLFATYCGTGKRVRRGTVVWRLADVDGAAAAVDGDDYEMPS